MFMKNKKGIAPIALVMAVFIGILFLIFFSGGGIGTTFEITKFLSSIPAPVWVIVGVLFLLKLISGGKRR